MKVCSKINGIFQTLFGPSGVKSSCTYLTLMIAKNFYLFLKPNLSAFMMLDFHGKNIIKIPMVKVPHFVL